MRNFVALLLAAMIVSLFGASLLAWVWTIVRAFMGVHPVPYEPRRHAPWGLADLVLVVVLLVVAAIGARYAFPAIFNVSLATPLAEMTTVQQEAVIAANSLITITAAAGSVFLIWLRSWATPADFGVVLRRAPHDVLLGCRAFLLMAGPVYAMQAALSQFVDPHHPLIDIVYKSGPGPIFATVAVAAVVVAPMVEELWFRVLLQGWLEKLNAVGGDVLKILFGERHGRDDDTAEALAPVKIPPLEAQVLSDEGPPPEGAPSAGTSAGHDANPYAAPRTSGNDWHSPSAAKSEPPSKDAAAAPWWGIPISALIFALMHFSYGPSPIPLFFLALGLGFLYRQTHRVLPSMTVHLLLNGTSMLMLLADVIYNFSGKAG